MEGTTLLIFHLISISAIVIITFFVAFNAGKNSNLDSIEREKKKEN